MKQKHCCQQGFNQLIFQHCFLQMPKSIDVSLTRGYYYYYFGIITDTWEIAEIVQRVPCTLHSTPPPVVMSYMAVVQYQNQKVGIGTLLRLVH